MSYYDKIINDDLSTLEYKKSKYNSYSNYLDKCVTKLRNYEKTIDNCKISLGSFLINDEIFASNKISDLSSNVVTLRRYISNTMIPIVKQNVDTIKQRIYELSTASSAQEPVVPSVPLPPGKGNNGSRVEFKP